MSDPCLDTAMGRLLFGGLWPLERVLSLVGAPTVEGFLLSRHRVIDAYLHEAIADGSIRQVVELACGLSPRGLMFHRRYGDRITYVEADLPDMARLKRRRLDRAGAALDESHRVEEVDVLADDGPLAVSSLMEPLDPQAGTAIVTEGLVNYFDRPTAESMFARFSAALGTFDNGLYITDLYLAGDNRNPLSTVFSAALGTFVGSSVHTFYASEHEAVLALMASGFGSASAVLAGDHPAAGRTGRDPGASLVRVVRATV